MLVASADVSYFKIEGPVFESSWFSWARKLSESIEFYKIFGKSISELNFSFFSDIISLLYGHSAAAADGHLNN